MKEKLPRSKLSDDLCRGRENLRCKVAKLREKAREKIAEIEEYNKVLEGAFNIEPEHPVIPDKHREWLLA